MPCFAHKEARKSANQMDLDFKQYDEEKQPLSLNNDNFGAFPLQRNSYSCNWRFISRYYFHLNAEFDGKLEKSS